MSQINLLNQTSKPTGFDFDHVLSGIAKFLAVVLLAVFVYFGYVWYETGTVTKEITAVQTKIDSDREDIVNNKDRAALLVRQGQLKELDTILAGHLYWSKLFPELARATLASTSFVSFAALADGTANVAVSVQDYAQLDKFLQVFDLPQFNKNFSDVKIVSINKTQEEGVVKISVKLQFKYSTDFLKPTKTN